MDTQTNIEKIREVRSPSHVRFYAMSENLVQSNDDCILSARGNVGLKSVSPKNLLSSTNDTNNEVRLRYIRKWKIVGKCRETHLLMYQLRSWITQPQPLTTESATLNFMHHHLAAKPAVVHPPSRYHALSSIVHPLLVIRQRAHDIEGKSTSPTLTLASVLRTVV